MGQQKKLKKIVDAVKGILGGEVKKKKLKKAKALKRFVTKMEARQKDIQAELKKSGLKKDREKMLRRHLDTLDKQIMKARKILKEMDS